MTVREEKEHLLKIVFDGLGQRYPQGLYEWLYIHDRGVYDRINHLEDMINDEILNGGTIARFKELLREYWIVHIKAIRSFNESGAPDNSLNEVRAERIRELETVHLS